MKSPDSLFRLIKSLSKQEKWYFKAFAKWNSLKDDSNYIRLFDLMDSQEEYDEGKLKKRISTRPLAESFAETKYQLYPNILKSLHAFHLQSSADIRLKILIHQIEILFNKALYGEAFRFIQQGKKIARHYENFIALLDILEWERMTILYSFEQERMSRPLEDLAGEKARINALLNNQNRYSVLNDRLFILHQKSGVVRDAKTRKEYATIMNHPLLRDVRKALSYEAKISFYHSHKICAFAMQDSSTYYKFSMLHVQTLEEKPHLIEERMTRYIGSLYSLAMAQNDNQQYAEFLRTLARMRAIPDTYKSGKRDLNRLKIFELSYREELSYYWYSGNFERGNILANEAISRITHYRKLLTGHSLTLLYYELAKIKFGVKRFREALDCVDVVANKAETGTREDIVAVLRIMRLIIHFELGNNLLLPYIIKSTYRYLFKKKRLYKMETVILHYLRKLERIRNQKELLQSFKVLRAELNKLNKDPYEKIGLEYFDFIAWLDSKIEKKDFGVVMRAKFSNPAPRHS